MDFLLSIGIENIAVQVESLAAHLEAGVRARGYEVIIERHPDTGSGIVSFRHPRIDCGTIGKGLAQNRIAAAIRQGWIRMAPHFYISRGELDQVLELLPPV